MGADMLLAGFVVSREFAEGTLEYREQRKKAMLEELEKLSIDDLIELGDYMGDSEDLPNLKTIAKEAIEEAFNNLDSRDVTAWYYDKVAFFLTGGMSWGDSPTDSYDAFQKVSLLPDKILNHLLS
jgi:hypothetical protein